MNRGQRRKYESKTGEKPPTDLREWKDSETVARRGEVWEGMRRVIRVNDLLRMRNTWYARLQRRMNRIFRVKYSQIDPETGDEQE